MTLGEKQELFLIHEIFLLDKATELGNICGFTVRGGDAFRDPRVHGAFGEKVGYGAANSMHKLKLARDLYFIKDGKLLSDVEYYKELGVWWEDQHELCCWGGRWYDGVHFSMTHAGFK